MKFELVEFYPITEKNRGNASKNNLGTIHVYCIDQQIDLRGIKVMSTKGKAKEILFFMPHVRGFDCETGDKISYPIFRWTDQKNHEALMNFLHQEVKPVIKTRIKEAKNGV